MKHLLALLALCLPIYLFAQGFGSFSHDQPFFAKDTTTSGTNVCFDAIINPDFHWVASDISSNTPVAVWNDRVQGYPLIQTNDWTRPTNSADGLCFDGSKWMFMSNSLRLYTNNTIFVICNPSPRGTIGSLLSDTNLITYIRLSPSNTVTMAYLATMVGGPGVQSLYYNPTQQLDLCFTQEKIGGNQIFNGYTNGVAYGTASSGSPQNAQIDSLGSYGNVQTLVFGRFDMMFHGYVKEIMIWTNQVASAANACFLHEYAMSTYGGNKTPFVNPDSTNLYIWARADGPYNGEATGINLTNGSRSGTILNAKNYIADGNARFEGGSPRWYTNAGPNGRPAWNFGETTGSPSRAVIYRTSIARSQPNYYFFVLNYTNTSNANQDLLDEGDGLGNRQQHMFIPNSGTGLLGLYAGGPGYNYNYNLRTNSWVILTSCVNGSSSYIRTNGVNAGIAGASVGANPIARESIGDYGQGGGYPWGGFIAEYMMYSGAGVTTNDIQNAEQYLANKYGITYYGQP